MNSPIRFLKAIVLAAALSLMVLSVFPTRTEALVGMWCEDPGDTCTVVVKGKSHSLERKN